MDELSLRERLKAERARAYSLKTKKAQSKAWAKVRETEREILKHVYAQRDLFATHSVKGTVRWFHAGDDHVCVSTPYGSLYASPTSDVVSKSWYGSTCCVEYTEGQEVILEIDVDVDLERLCLQLIPKRVYGGTLNETQYAELCKRNDLAFFKYPNGRMSGLFSSKETSND